MAKMADTKTPADTIHVQSGDDDCIFQNGTDTKASSIQADWSPEEEKRAKRKYDASFTKTTLTRS